MTCTNLVKLLKFWQNRQEQLGKEAAFRWSFIWDGKNRLPAEYGTRALDAAEAKRQAQAEERRQKRLEELQMSAIVDDEDEDAGGKKKKKKKKKKDEKENEPPKKKKKTSPAENETTSSAPQRPAPAPSTLTQEDIDMLDPCFFKDDPFVTWSGGPLPSVPDQAKDAGVLKIDLGLMDLARTLGYRSNSVNGPNDGEPAFLVPLTAYEEVLRKYGERYSIQEANPDSVIAHPPPAPPAPTTPIIQTAQKPQPKP